MNATAIQDLLKATVLVGPLPQEEIMTACGSDMMSDVLAFPKDKMVLLTGLTNPHTVRTAELLDVLMLVFVRGKLPNEEVLNMAEDAGIAVLGTEYTLYDACGGSTPPAFRAGRGAKNERRHSRKLRRGKGRLRNRRRGLRPHQEHSAQIGRAQPGDPPRVGRLLRGGAESGHSLPGRHHGNHHRAQQRHPRRRRPRPRAFRIWIWR